MISSLVLAVLFIQTFTPFSGALASETKISISPDSLTASLGDNITIAMNASNVSNLYGWQAAVKYNASIINCTGVWLPADNVFAGQPTLSGSPILNDGTLDGLNYALWGVSLFSGSVTFAQGTLFKMNFTVVGYGETAVQIGTIQNPIRYNPGFPQTWYTYIQDPDLNEIPLTEENGNVVVAAAKAQVTFNQTGVGSDFAGTVVTIDGVNYTRTGMPLSFTWDLGSNHAFIYQSPLLVTANTKRYLWNSTSGPVPLQSGNITVTTAQTVTGNYRTQFQVSFSQVGISDDFTGTIVTIDGTGYNHNALPAPFWYDNGTTHDFAFQSPLLANPDAKQYVWTSTTGLSALLAGTLVISSSGNITGNYKTQYYLTVASSHGSPVPDSGWWDAGSSITASVSSPVAGSSGTRYVCTGWTGNGSVPTSGGELNTTFTIIQPSSIVWNWKTQHILTVSTSPEGLSPQPSISPPGEAASADSWWYDFQANVTLTANTVENWTFDFWKVDGVSQDQGIDTVAVTVDSVHTAIAYYASNNTATEISLLNLTVSKTIVCQGYSAAINATVENKGVNTESFNLTIYANATTVASLTVALESGNSTEITVIWNTTSFMIGNYTINAYAEPLPSETDTADNTFTNGLVYIAIVGDINGDGRVDMKDVGYMARRFLISQTDALWDPNTDINGDGKIDMKDIGTAARHFGEHYP